VRKASTGASVSAAKKRERVERAGSWSRSRPGHEGDRKGLEPLVESLQGAFPEDFVTEEDHEKIDHLVVSEAPPRKAHTLADLGQDSVLAKMRSQQHDFAKPRRGRGNRLGRGLDDYRSIGDTGHMYLLKGMELFFPFKEAHFYPCSLRVSSSLRIAWVMASEQGQVEQETYDEGRLSERIMLAAAAYGVGSSIGWFTGSGRAAAKTILGVPKERLVRTVISLGYPDEEAIRARPKHTQARKPLSELVYVERYGVHP